MNFDEMKPLVDEDDFNEYPVESLLEAAEGIRQNEPVNQYDPDWLRDMESQSRERFEAYKLKELEAEREAAEMHASLEDEITKINNEINRARDLDRIKAILLAIIAVAVCAIAAQGV